MLALWFTMVPWLYAQACKVFLFSFYDESLIVCKFSNSFVPNIANSHCNSPLLASNWNSKDEQRYFLWKVNSNKEDMHSFYRVCVQQVEDFWYAMGNQRSGLHIMNQLLPFHCSRMKLTNVGIYDVCVCESYSQWSSTLSPKNCLKEYENYLKIVSLNLDYKAFSYIRHN